jgi:predicted helicase
LDIFHYTYAVLHDPAYRQKYAQNLKRDLPRVPFYPNFWQWVEWGQQLMEWHLNYETVEKYPLRRLDQKLATNVQNQVKLKADKVAGQLVIDDQTTLTGVPALAWEYQLGNRSALEWLLDQYKEKKPKDPTIAEKFNTYRFADYKEEMIELLQRVCTVSVKTMEIVQTLREE